MIGSLKTGGLCSGVLCQCPGGFCPRGLCLGVYVGVNIGRLMSGLKVQVVKWSDL